jgi:hypothetical protein
MRIEVYDKSAPKPEPEPVRLALRKEGGLVHLFAVERDGDRVPSGTLLTFQIDGTIIRNGGVNPDLGFKQDAHGRIIVEDE